jgi:hypothetical protein
MASGSSSGDAGDTALSMDEHIALCKKLLFGRFTPPPDDLVTKTGKLHVNRVAARGFVNAYRLGVLVKDMDKSIAGIPKKDKEAIVAAFQTMVKHLIFPEETDMSKNVPSYKTHKDDHEKHTARQMCMKYWLDAFVAPDDPSIPFEDPKLSKIADVVLMRCDYDSIDLEIIKSLNLNKRFENYTLTQKQRVTQFICSITGAFSYCVWSKHRGEDRQFQLKLVVDAL